MTRATKQKKVLASSHLSHCIRNLSKVRSMWTGQLISYQTILRYLRSCGYEELRTASQVRYHAIVHGAAPRRADIDDEISQLITRYGLYPIKPKGVLRSRAG